MNLLDLLGLKRRRERRYKVKWLVDVKMPDSDSYMGFFTCDFNSIGVRLEGNRPDVFKGSLSAGDRTDLRLRIPGQQAVLEVEAELCYQIVEMGKYITGWKFTRNTRKARQMLSTFIANYPDQAEPS